MAQDLGVTPSGSGHSDKPELVPVSAASAASVPNAECRHDWRRINEPHALYRFYCSRCGARTGAA